MEIKEKILEFLDESDWAMLSIWCLVILSIGSGLITFFTSHVSVKEKYKCHIEVNSNHIQKLDNYPNGLYIYFCENKLE